MRHYFETVTLGSFTWKNEDRLKLLYSHISAEGVPFLILHFFLLAICLNFPVTFIIARLDPADFFSRLYGEEALINMGETADINSMLIESGYGRTTLLPMLGFLFFIIVIILAAFFLFTGFFIGVARMNSSFMNFRSRFSLALFSSTLPALISAIIGFVLPAVHILIFCLAVILITFQRNNRLRFAET